jgi:hypothetical protein
LNISCNHDKNKKEQLEQQELETPIRTSLHCDGELQK